MVHLITKIFYNRYEQWEYHNDLWVGDETDIGRFQVYFFSYLSYHIHTYSVLSSCVDTKLKFFRHLDLYLKNLNFQLHFSFLCNVCTRHSQYLHLGQVALNLIDFYYRCCRCCFNPNPHGIVRHTAVWD